MTDTTWNPSDQIGIDFSGGNLIATGHSFNFNGMRATNAHPKPLAGSAKVYFEIACNSSFSDGRSLLGIGDENGALGADPLGASEQIFLNKAGTSIGIAGITISTVTFGNINGQTFGIAIDIGAKKFWMTNDGVTWNSGGSNDPATGVTDVSQSTTGPWSSLFTGTNLLPQGTIIDAGASMTLNVGNSAFAYAVPSGFAAWDAPAGSFWISTEAPDSMVAAGYTGAFGVVGDVLATEAKDAAAFTGIVPSVGALATTETKDNFSAFGFQPLSGTLAATGNPDVMHATGIGLGEDGIFITTEAVDIFAAAGNTPIFGSFDTTETPDHFLALGAGVIRVRRRRTIFVT